MNAVAVILGSAFDSANLAGQPLEPVRFDTPFGEATLHRYPRADRPAWVLFRHGAPHAYLPNQIPYQAQAAALHSVGCGALLVTSSVGLLRPELPVDQPLLVADLIMMDNRLPDGSACTMFPEPAARQGHLVLDEGICSVALSEQVAALCSKAGWPIGAEVVFAYVAGPRTKTAAENRLWPLLGADVNSMTVGPELVLAGDLEIPATALVIGHKHSVPGVRERLGRPSMRASLEVARERFESLCGAFLDRAEPVPFRNRIYRY